RASPLRRRAACLRRLLLALHSPAVELVARRKVLQFHAELRVLLVQDRLYLVQRLAAEVLGLEHLLLGLLDELADVLDVGVLEAVRRADRALAVVRRRG